MNSTTNKNNPQKGTREWLRKQLEIPPASYPEEYDQQDLFEETAMKGWKSSSEGLKLMENLDKKYRIVPTGFSGYVFNILFLIAALIVSSVNDFSSIHQAVDTSSENSTFTEITHSLSKDKGDIHILPIHQQIKAPNLVKTFRKQRTYASQTETVKNEEYIPPLSLRTNTPVYTSRDVSIARATGKEIYIEGLKLLDYRAYRKRPDDNGRQKNELTGTPADREQKTTIPATDTTWDESKTAYIDYIRIVMKDYQKADYKKVLSKTQQILQAYPEDLNALFYAGLAAFNLQRTDVAIFYFEKVTGNQFGNFDEEAIWFLANCYHSKNETARTKQLLESIIRQNGFYRMQAERLLKKINL